MRSIYLIILFNIVTAHIYAQTVRINESELFGVWQYGIDFTDLDTAANLYNNSAISEYTFLPSGHFEFKYFRITQTHFDTCLIYTTPGKWKLKNNVLTLTYNTKKSVFIASDPMEQEDRSEEEIIKANQDSLLVFNPGFYDLEGYHKPTYTIYYKRLSAPIQATENGKDSCNNFYTSQPVNLQPVILQPETFAYKPNYKYLINSLDSTKVVRIPEDRNIDIYYKEELNDSIYKYKSLNGFGYIDSIYEDSIIVSLYEMDINFSDENDFESLYTGTSIYGEATPYIITTIDLNNMPEIGFSTNTSDALESISAFGMSFGVFTALIVAPLISINYKSGEFRDQRYYKIAGYSLGVSAISLPLFLFSGSKSYTIIPSGSEPAENKWYLSY